MSEQDHSKQTLSLIIYCEITSICRVITHFALAVKIHITISKLAPPINCIKHVNPQSNLYFDTTNTSSWRFHFYFPLKQFWRVFEIATYTCTWVETLLFFYSSIKADTLTIPNLSRNGNWQAYLPSGPTAHWYVIFLRGAGWKGVNRGRVTQSLIFRHQRRSSHVGYHKSRVESAVFNQKGRQITER